MGKEKQFVIVRGEPGVYAGYLESAKDDTVELSEVFCLYRWSGAATLNQVALEGVKKPNDCMFSLDIPKMVLHMRWFQILPCTEAAKKSLIGVKRWSL